jgi:hypothetical protein
LPTEAEWEFAARGGLEEAVYVWGDEFAPGGRLLANTWQGRFPWENLQLDGFDGTSPVDAFPPNGYGVYDMAGNVWEWTCDIFSPGHSPARGKPCCSPGKPHVAVSRQPSDSSNHTQAAEARHVIKGGSHLCAPNYCLRYRPAARQGEAVDTSTCHLGFRCVLRPPRSSSAHVDETALALALAVLLPRTRLRSVGRLVAVVLPSLLIALIGADVQIVSDVGGIGGSIPIPQLPAFNLVDTLNIVTGALSVTIVTLVQGVGVSQSVPNSDGSRTRISCDFIAHGAANVACGLFRGLPVGGSLSGTAINVISGAVTRWASIFAGLWMAVIVVAVPTLVGFIAMPALGALLIVAGASSLKPSEVAALRNAGWPSVLAGGTTYLATLFLPIQAAVGLGVVLSALLFLTRTASAVTIVQLVRHDDGRIEERTAPRHLPSGAVTVLDVYGDLFYAGARTFERLLPRVPGSDRAAVVLRLRGRRTLDATLIDVLSRYANDLEQANGRLYLTGVSDAAHQQIVRSDKLQLREAMHAHRATPFVWASTQAAVDDARAWLAGRGEREGATPRS